MHISSAAWRLTMLGVRRASAERATRKARCISAFLLNWPWDDSCQICDNRGPRIRPGTGPRKLELAASSTQALSADPSARGAVDGVAPRTVAHTYVIEHSSDGHCLLPSSLAPFQERMHAREWNNVIERICALRSPRCLLPPRQPWWRHPLP
jgi:hypothetical protein